MAAMRDRPDPGEQLDRVAVLSEPVRRRLYEVVVRAGEPVDRDTAAERAGVGRPLAAFHLDRLVLAGLLDVEYRRRTGRTGPGAGRPAKFYLRPPDLEVSVELPPRSYDVAADILAAGVERAGPARESVLQAARERGREMAEMAQRAERTEPATAEGSTPGASSGAGPGAGGRLIPMLESQGYEPFEDADGVIRLRNCPFHHLVDEHRELTCAMNHALLDGASSVLPETGYEVVSQPREGLCCVAFVPEQPEQQRAR